MHNTGLFPDCRILSVTDGCIWIPYLARYLEIIKKPNFQVVKCKPTFIWKMLSQAELETEGSGLATIFGLPPTPRQDRHLSCLWVCLTQSEVKDTTRQTERHLFWQKDICFRQTERHLFQSQVKDTTRQTERHLFWQKDICFRQTERHLFQSQVKDKTRQTERHLFWQKDICFVFESKTDLGSRSDIQQKTVQLIPRGVTFSNAVSKLKAQSSNVSFATFWWKEILSLVPRFSRKRRSSFELWALKELSKMSPHVALAVKDRHLSVFE